MSLYRTSLYEERTEELIDHVERIAHRLETPGDLDPLLERIGEARYVLLGEASHGTSEYYTWRAQLSRRLIQEKGFSFIAVEGDWPDSYSVNRYIKGYPEAGESAREVLQAFERWPTWMWANWEIVALAEWLRQYNEGRREKAGFYGLDVYSLWDSMQAIIDYLEKTDPEAAKTAKQVYMCFEPYGEDVQAYAWATTMVPNTCEEEVIELLSQIRSRVQQYPRDMEATFNAEQNALVMVNAERYYRAMVQGGPDSWNLRDHHMVDTLDRLMESGEPEAKAIVWAHNTHIGDARFTDMQQAGMVNVGQLVREQHEAEGVVLVGFGSHHGHVIAGQEWGAPMERMRVPIAQQGSWEDVLHRAGEINKLLILDETRNREDFLDARGHRAIGVVYHPYQERYGNYVPTILPHRYDAFLHIDETQALHPLHIEPQKTGEPPETYPWGF
jgi:erythromycin esterase-like protein